MDFYDNIFNMLQDMLFKIILDKPKLTILVKDNKMKGVLKW